jgi:pimeloyl-ACP methyl ester carboxylesterase
MLNSFAGGRLLGTRSGTQQPWVLALHGWARSHRDFATVVEGIDAIAIDLPGFGAAPEPPEVWSTSQYAEWIAPILDELAPGAVIVGHSFGGRVAVHLAAAHPDTIGAVVLTGVPLVRNPNAPRRRPSLTYRVGRTLYRYRLISDARMEAQRQRYGSADYKTATPTMRGVLVKAVNETYEPALAAYPGPIELVWGDDDDQAPLAVAEAAIASCQQAKLVTCPGAGHFVPLKAPDCLRDAILRHPPNGPQP